MRELTSEEMKQVNGGALDPYSGAAIIFGLSSATPLTMAFGYPIAGALVLTATLAEM